MNDSTLIKDISSNYIRAQHAADEKNNREELMHLLFAAKGISDLLIMWYDYKEDCIIDNTYAASYSESLQHTTKRISELICKGALNQ